MPLNSNVEFKNDFFREQTKNEIMSKSLSQITRKLDEMIAKSERRGKALPDGSIKGLIFEELAVNERLTNNPETPIQTQVRRIIEENFRSANLLVGSFGQMMIPDSISVIFDRDGRLQIKEAVEVKMSVETQKHSAREGQPQNTIDTLENLLSIINSIVEGKDLTQLPNKGELTAKQSKKREILLFNLQAQIQSIGIKESISFSPDMKYIVILPINQRDKNVSNFSINLKGGDKIDSLFQYSQFSDKDITRIIDHYAENNIE